jgi:hypothetical protein
MQRKSLATQITPLIQQHATERPEHGEGKLPQAKGLPGEIATISPFIEAGIDNLGGRGQPLSQSDRAFFESRFGCDFSQVLLHTNAEAAELTQAVNARAFTVTVGPHIVWRGVPRARKHGRAAALGSRVDTCRPANSS